MKDNEQAKRDRANAVRRARRAANPEKEAAARAKQRELDKQVPGRLEDRRAKNAEYMRAKSASTEAQRQEYNSANSAHIVAKVATWRKSNPARFAVQQHNARARNAGIEGSLSTWAVQRAHDAQAGKCACCGKLFDGVYQVDHIIPLARGGTNVDSNIQLLTPECNRQKGTKTMEEFTLWKLKKAIKIFA